MCRTGGATWHYTDTMRTGLFLLLSACSAASTAPGSDDAVTDDSGVEDVTGQNPYDRDHLMEVEIELSESDWETLRHQTRNLLDLIGGESCIEETWESPYDWFIGTVTIDGQRMEMVEVRKKGLIGSQTSERPSLKLDFNDHIDDQAFMGLTRLTLNNGRQDGSRVVQCMGYWLYEDAGIPASRCSYAHVTVNGEDLGVYANVEPVKDPLLERHFGSSDGALFEGTLSDFRDGWTGSFDDKADDGDFAPVEAVAAALESDDPVTAVGELIDLEAWHRAWAMEVLIGHWDSYSGNTNNFYVYVDPADGKMRFIPWGIDAILQGVEPFGEGAPTTIVAEAALPSALAASDEARADYYDALDALLAEVWDEDVLEARLDAAVALTEDAAWPDNNDGGWHWETVSEIRSFINNRREQITDERAGGDPVPDPGLRDDPCLTDQGSLSVSFETSWGTYGSSPTFSTGSNAWQLTIGGVDYPVTPLGSVIGASDGATILFVSGQLEDGANVGLYGYAEGTSAVVAGEQALWEPMQTYLLYDGDGDYDGWQTWAYLGGSLSLTEAGVVWGDAVTGTATTTIFGGS